MSQFDIDAVIVGAGAVGLASAYALSRRGLSVIVLERARLIGSGVSSRNSEVVHAGLHYTPGTLRAAYCVAGRRKLYEFMDAHHVAYDKCGKLIVAAEEAEIPALDTLERHALANGVEGVRRLSAAEARAMEPELNCVAAIYSAESGVFDSHGYMLALRGEIEGAGGAIAMDTPFEGAAPLAGGGFSIRAGGAEPMEIAARYLVIAAGLGAQDAARRIENFPEALIPPLHLAKGNYFTIDAKAPFQRLIYPPPVASGHGAHYRRDLGGRAHFGPDTEWVTTENYDVNTARAANFYAQIRRYWPGLRNGALVPDYAGIRPKLHGPGEAQPDFRIDGPETHKLPDLVCLFGIESPGLTSSLAIGEAVSKKLGGE
jgi:L-2-hydroxyglutarate oxidase LhgO